MSLGISGGKQVIKFANTRNRGRFCFFSSKKGDDDFSYAKCTVTWVSTRFMSLLLAARTSAVATVYKKVTMTTLTHNLPLFFLLEDFKYCSYSATSIYACIVNSVVEPFHFYSSLLLMSV